MRKNASKRTTRPGMTPLFYWIPDTLHVATKAKAGKHRGAAYICAALAHVNSLHGEDRDKFRAKVDAIYRERVTVPRSGNLNARKSA